MKTLLAGISTAFQNPEWNRLEMIRVNGIFRLHIILYIWIHISLCAISSQQKVYIVTVLVKTILEDIYVQIQIIVAPPSQQQQLKLGLGVLDFYTYLHVVYI